MNNVGIDESLSLKLSIFTGIELILFTLRNYSCVPHMWCSQGIRSEA